MLTNNGAEQLPAEPNNYPVQAGQTSALEVANASLMLETRRCEQLERELLRAQEALERVRADLSGTRASERHALHLANHDGLTALPNRRAFLDRMRASLGEAVDNAQGLAILFIDLDRFKQVNDCYGHPVGDELLKVVSSRLIQAVRGRDAVGRLGGDEFACLLKDVSSRQEVARVAAKLFNVVAAPTRLGPIVLSIRPSIGIALFRNGDHLSAEQLMQQADSAMYIAKRQQCRYVFFQRSSDRPQGPFAPMAGF